MKKLNTLIAPTIYANISAGTRIMSLVGECLPIDFTAHIEYISSSESTLNLATDSAAHSSRLRFYTDAILTVLHNNGLTQFRTIKVTTHPAHSVAKPATKPRTTALPLSAHTQKIIRSTASSIENQRLRQALIKLADLSSKV